jgi:hypothetical protein
MRGRRIGNVVLDAIASAATHSVSAEGAPRRAPCKPGLLALAKGIALPI